MTREDIKYDEYVENKKRQRSIARELHRARVTFMEAGTYLSEVEREAERVNKQIAEYEQSHFK